MSTFRRANPFLGISNHSTTVSREHKYYFGGVQGTRLRQSFTTSWAAVDNIVHEDIAVCAEVVLAIRAFVSPERTNPVGYCG